MSTTYSDSDAAQLDRQAVRVLRDHWHLLLIEGIILLLLGAAAIIVPQAATLPAPVLLSWLFFISGVVGLITSLMMQHAPGFGWSLFSALVAIAAGVGLIEWPANGALSLTILLIGFFVLEGIATVMYALEHKHALSGRWGLLLLSGIVDLLLAPILLTGLPDAAAWPLGLLVGVNMLLGGAALIGFALHARDAPA